MNSTRAIPNSQPLRCGFINGNNTLMPQLVICVKEFNAQSIIFDLLKSKALYPKFVINVPIRVFINGCIDHFMVINVGISIMLQQISNLYHIKTAAIKVCPL